jgi:hypothetical protein
MPLRKATRRDFDESLCLGWHDSLVEPKMSARPRRSIDRLAWLQLTKRCRFGMQDMDHGDLLGPQRGRPHHVG